MTERFGKRGPEEAAKWMPTKREPNDLKLF
jgi:hypothetical protein